jgi:glycosyl transferase, family 25
MLNDFITQNIDRKYVINLKRRKDRYNEFKNRCSKYFDSDLIERFDAIDGKEVKQDELFLDVLKKCTSKGVIGCFLSHVGIWEKVIKDETLKDDDIILIFEDDVFFLERHFENKFKEAILDFKKLNDEKKLLYIGGRFKIGFNVCLSDLQKSWKKLESSSLKERIYIENYEKLIFDRTTHCYIITKNTARILYNEAKVNTKKPVAVDNFLLWCGKKDIIKTYDYFPHLCYSPVGYKTDIFG